MMNLTFDNVTPIGALAWGLVLSGGYVASLYLVSTGKSRDEPNTVKRRILAVSGFALVSPVVLILAGEHQDTAPPLLHHLGLRWGIETVKAAVYPLILVMLLFLGPLVQELGNAISSPAPHMGWVAKFWSDIDIFFVRNIIIAPITEEFVYRACIIPLLLPSFGATWTVWTAPLFFGVAHLHHVLSGHPPMQVACMFGYTTLFGWITAFIFVRTGYIIGPVLCHAFCNYMGLPDFGGALANKRTLGFPYVTGLVGFFCLLHPLTNIM